LWEWANDPEVRAAAFATGFIPWEDHVQWFSRKLADPGFHLFLVEDDRGTPVGQVRFDVIGEGEAEIDVSIAKHRRGSGYGARAINMAVEELFNTSTVRLVHSYIKVDNQKSLRAFDQAGFFPRGRETVKGEQVWHYWRKKSDAK
jgi:RimJ/RimL family protein N-acetyltransferase